MRRSQIKLLQITFLASLFFNLSENGLAQMKNDTTLLKEVVITGTRITIPEEKSGKSIYKFTKEDIYRNAGKSVVDLLNEVPGIQTDGNFGAPGTNISYFVRGGRNSQTLILIDGVPLNDPSGISFEYDLRNLPLSQIESIEVLKGGLSTLYGTGAAAGVINIKLTEAGKERFNGKINVHGGSFDTFGQDLEINGRFKKWNYLFSAQNEISRGFSSALDQDNVGGFDKDGSSRQNGLLKLGYNVNDQFSVAFQSAYDRFKSDFDAGAFIDGGNELELDQFRFGFRPKYEYSNGELALNVVFNDIERIFKSSFSHLKYEGRNLQVDLTNQHNFGSKLKAFFGVNLQILSNKQRESTFTSADFTILDPYASLVYSHDKGITVHSGIRLNTHSEYGNKFIFNVNPSYLFDLNNGNQLKVFGSVATSFITPSLYQTYSEFGNLDLKPEEVINYEGGVSLYLGKKINLNTVYYYRDETEPIGFVSLFDDNGDFVGGLYQNFTTERNVNGFEFDGKWQINKQFTLVANYALAATDDESGFYRIPKHKMGASIQVTPLDDLRIGLKYNYTSERTIFDFTTFSTLELESYGLVDFYASYRLFDEKLKVYGGINNIFDIDFVAIQGFTTRGINFDIGISYRFK